MSGHSKWHKIQHKKGKNDAARGSMFTKLCKAITIAAKEGGGDPDMNFSLRLAIEKAKAGNVPKDNIERAVKRGTGELKDAAEIEEIMYEGFGPAGVGVLVECATDNTNRTVGEVKHAFSKHGGSVGSPGSVQWQFVRLGVVRIAAAAVVDKEAFELLAIDAGADDILEEALGFELRCPVEKLKVLLDALGEQGIAIEDSGREWIAKDATQVSQEDAKKVDTLVDALDELDDVVEVYTSI